eukprot:scaffold143_cov364-Pavlova_lutheri.AAC.2
MGPRLERLPVDCFDVPYPREGLGSIPETLKGERPVTLQTSQTCTRVHRKEGGILHAKEKKPWPYCDQRATLRPLPERIKSNLKRQVWHTELPSTNLLACVDTPSSVDNHGCRSELLADQNLCHTQKLHTATLAI